MLDLYCISEDGGRSVNEDSFAAFGTGKLHGFVVCDGLGGMGRGDVASKTVCACIRAAFAGLDPDSVDIEARIKTGMTAAENELRRLQREYEDPRGFKSTADVLVIRDNKAYYAHCGDSRIYRFENGNYVWRTKDHSLAQMFVYTGEIEESEIRSCEDRSVLLHAMGAANESFDYETGTIELAGGKIDAFIICTDGFWQFITGEAMQAAFASAIEGGGLSAKSWLEPLADRVRRMPDEDKDNFTAVAVILDREDMPI